MTPVQDRASQRSFDSASQFMLRVAEKQGLDLWVTSFSADYLGYISPDEYYHEVRDAKGNPEYETGLMSWAGPRQEAYFTALKDRMVTALTNGRS